MSNDRLNFEDLLDIIQSGVSAVVGDPQDTEATNRFLFLAYNVLNHVGDEDCEHDWVNLKGHPDPDGVWCHRCNAIRDLDAEPSEDREKQPVKQPVKVHPSSLKVRTYAVMERAVEEGIALGWNRAHKHQDDPKPEHVREKIEENVLLTISEWFEFD